MRCLSGFELRYVLVGFVAAMVLGGGSVKADFTFGEPAIVDLPIDSGFWVEGCSFSSDGQELYLSMGPRTGNAGGRVYGRFDIWVATRETVYNNEGREVTRWKEPVNLGPNVNSPEKDDWPTISPDGLELYFTYSGLIVASTRTSKDTPWSSAEFLDPIVNSDNAWMPEISADGLSLYFSSDRPGGSGDRDIWVTTRASKADPWSEPVNLGPNVNSPSAEYSASISADDTVLFFWSGRSGKSEIWMSRRASKYHDWSQAVNLGPMINVSGNQCGPEISPDSSTLYFSSGPGVARTDLYHVSLIPTVDFTGDYKVDIEDLIVLIENWGQNEPSLDVGPMPWGDGVINAADLEVLMSYWGQKVHDPHLLAHWKLDETEGDLAYDSAAQNDALVMGDALWQPDGGHVEGAIHLDGINDYVKTPHLLNPADGPFSVFAWIKGGAPGQVIISQEDGADWLATDTQGCLMTALISSGRSPGDPLVSETTVTDGNWHRIGLVWDRSYRSLYVDDELAAVDMALQNNFPNSEGALCIGVANNRQPSTFWSGLIDDVRIYSRAVEP